MVLIGREILDLAMEALKEKFTLPNDVVINKEDGAYGNFDAFVQIMNVDFLCEIKDNITATNINTIVNHLQKCKTIENKPVLLVAKYINPNMFDKLVGLGLNILDCTGNCHIRYMNGNIPVFHLIDKGEKMCLPMKKHILFFRMQESK